MPSSIKYIWIALLFIMLLGLFINTPVEKSHEVYMKELDKIQSEPQRRLDATHRYIEAIENGEEDIANGIKKTPPRKYYIDSEDEEFPLAESKEEKTTSQKKYSRPLYIRDKNNPKILHPYNGK